MLDGLTPPERFEHRVEAPPPFSFYVAAAAIVKRRVWQLFLAIHGKRSF
jgi:hypothetical protein